MPGVGEIIGSGVREYDHARLLSRLTAQGLNPDDYTEYLVCCSKIQSIMLGSGFLFLCFVFAFCLLVVVLLSSFFPIVLICFMLLPLTYSVLHVIEIACVCLFLAIRASGSSQVWRRHDIGHGVGVRVYLYCCCGFLLFLVLDGLVVPCGVLDACVCVCV